MIAWLEQERPEPPVIPADPVQRYLVAAGRGLRRRVAVAPGDALPLVLRPRPLSGRHPPGRGDRPRSPACRRSQRRRWVPKRQEQAVRDAATGSTRAPGRTSRRATCACSTGSSRSSRERPFMLGERPTIADFGLMGPFWRHFVHDPTPARLMQDRAPAVFEWAARTWNARASELGTRPLARRRSRPTGSPLLREIGETHLEALAANAVAYTAGASDARPHRPGRRPTATSRPAPTGPGACGSCRRGSTSCPTAAAAGGPRDARAARLLGAAVAASPTSAATTTRRARRRSAARPGWCATSYVARSPAPGPAGA